jgi:hypothetical protein
MWTCDTLFPEAMGTRVVALDSRDADGDMPLHVMTHRHARRFGSFTTLAAADRRRYAVLAAIALAAIVCALPLALTDAMDLGAEMNMSKLIVRQVVYATAAFFVLLSCIALWRRKRADP